MAGGGFKRSARRLVERHHRRSNVQDLLRWGVQLPRNGIELASAEKDANTSLSYLAAVQVSVPAL